MKPHDTPEAMPSAYDSADYFPPVWNQQRAAALARLEAPYADEPWENQVAWMFDYSIEEAKIEAQYAYDAVDKTDRHELWSSSTLDEMLTDACRLLGLPCDFKRHEQPALLRRMFTPPLARMSVHEYMHDPMDPQRPLEFMTPEMVILWCRKARKIGEELAAIGVPLEDRMGYAINDLTVVGLRMLAWMWPEVVEARILALLDIRDFLKYTSGLFDLESGVLTDPDSAAAREYFSKTGVPRD